MLKDPRHLALEVLNRLERSHVLLDSLLEQASAEASFPDPRDQALFHTLVFGTLQWRARLDWVIASFSKTPLKKIDPPVLNILRLGLFQAALLDRVPASAAVNTSVELAKKEAPSWVIGFVNAVLRKAAKGWHQVPLPDARRDRVRHLAVRFSLPAWLVKRWIDQNGAEETEALCRAVNEIPPITARVNTLITDRLQLIKALEKECKEVHPGQTSPDAVIFRSPSVAVPELESHRNGWFQVQDEAAQLVVRLLDPQPGEQVLDACAGLGGKTGYIGQLMENRGRIVAAEKDGEKLRRLEAEMHRLSVSIVERLCGDLLEVEHPGADAFDRILLDAPCSGLGVLRKNPDARWRTEKRDLDRFAGLQGRLLSAVSRWVRPGGCLVYAVCSTEPEETEAVVELFLRSQPDFAVKPPDAEAQTAVVGRLDQRGFFSTAPHRDGTDGFFAVRLVRRITAGHRAPEG